MGQWLTQRRLTQTVARLKELREELRVVDDQLSHLAGEADDKSLRALVSETPMAEHEYREAQKHADAMRRHRDSLVTSIADNESRINELLDRMKETAR